MESGMDWMADPSHCDSPAPQVINISGGFSGTGQTGTDSTSRKLDDKVWTNRQTYVVYGDSLIGLSPSALSLLSRREDRGAPGSRYAGAGIRWALASPLNLAASAASASPAALPPHR